LHRCSQLYNQAVGRDEAGVLAVLAPGGFEETGLGIPLQSVIYYYNGSYVMAHLPHKCESEAQEDGLLLLEGFSLRAKIGRVGDF